jgi:hypothetical protein
MDLSPVCGTRSGSEIAWLKAVIVDVVTMIRSDQVVIVVESADHFKLTLRCSKKDVESAGVHFGVGKV